MRVHLRAATFLTAVHAPERAAGEAGGQTPLPVPLATVSELAQ